jgi:hypothetical protein
MATSSSALSIACVAMGLPPPLLVGSSVQLPDLKESLVALVLGYGCTLSNIVRNTSVTREGDFVLANSLVNAVTLVKISK